MNKVKTVEGTGTLEIAGEQLEKINRFSRRKLEAEEVFVFSVILCDNEVDRDFERFPKESLEKLVELFLGKTGIFDHSAKASNQRARIFDTELVTEEGRSNSLGEPYSCLRAWAYMVRCDKNADLILEIDAGIKKEVSVGCAVEEIKCSVCGENQKAGGCSHQKGKAYGDKVCHHLLLRPTDAYEWSFVAVPAQKNAGVTKKWAQAREGAPIHLDKWMAIEAKEDMVITKEQHRALAEAFAALKDRAGLGERYMEDLRRQVARLALLSHKEMDPAMLRQALDKMNLDELCAFEKSFSAAAREQFPLAPQTAGPAPSRKEDEQGGVTQFKV